MDLWTALLDVLILLLAALLLGALCERLKQSAILGYLLAGTLLGPNALDLMPSHKAVATIAELGVALLLFTIGLEFSWRRLRALGPIALGGGSVQIVLTGGLTAGICMSFGLGERASMVVGAMAALSSTACVLRLLVSRSEIDSVYGRNALGILLLQDIAVAPLVLITSSLGGEGPASLTAIGLNLGRAAGMAALLIAGLYVLLNYVVPLLLRAKEAARNRDLPILLAMVTAVGAAWAAHKLGLSPVLGAFIAGLLLAESPFATQIRADVGPLRTLFVTLFFSSIGMLANPAWVLEHWGLVAIVTGAVVIGKGVLTAFTARLFKASPGHSAATGLCLAQVGEFSFVLAETARQGGLIDVDLFELIIAATVGTLFLTPYLTGLAPRAALSIGRMFRGGAYQLSDDEAGDGEGIEGHIVIVGFGPAGQRVAETLMRRYKSRLCVVELNAKSADLARSYGLRAYVGDATRAEVLEHVHAAEAEAVVVTAPDPSDARRTIEQVRSLSPQTPVFARARYHVYRWELMLAGAEVVVDEEEEVGLRIAAAVRKRLRTVEFGGDWGDEDEGPTGIA